MSAPIIEPTENMVVEPRRRRATIMSAILSWLFPLRGVAYDTPLHRLLYLSLRKMPKERI